MAFERSKPAFNRTPLAFTLGHALTNNNVFGAAEAMWGEAVTATDWTNRTSLDAELALYLMASSTNLPALITDPAETVRQYDDYGAGYSTSQVAYVDSSGETAPSFSGVTVGQTNFPLPWCNEPDYTSTNTWYQLRGFAVQDELFSILFKFNYN